MASRILKLFLFAVFISGSATVVFSQAEFPDAQNSRPGRRRDDAPNGVKEMLAKQRAERDKRDHEELLERGAEALRLTNQLENSFAQNKGFSQQDKARLENLEKVVTKIRKELGGDDDENEEATMVEASESKPSTMEEAFKFLQTTTVKLVDELNKTTRFSISVVAIQSSNAVLKLVRFLRFKK
jgi:hypothetical protein